MSTTKECKRCQETKDVSCFAKNASSKDGLQSYCKDCTREINRQYHDRLKSERSSTPPHMKKVYSNIDLAKFTPKQLMDELRSRGYSGELKYTQTIKI